MEKKFKFATTFEKTFFDFFHFHFYLRDARCPPFVLPSIFLYQYSMRKNLSPEERQLVLDYTLRNLKRGPDAEDEIQSARFSVWNH